MSVGKRILLLLPLLTGLAYGAAAPRDLDVWGPDSPVDAQSFAWRRDAAITVDLDWRRDAAITDPLTWPRDAASTCELVSATSKPTGQLALRAELDVSGCVREELRRPVSMVSLGRSGPRPVHRLARDEFPHNRASGSFFPSLVTEHVRLQT